jgi:uncharacterized phage-associated protein
MTISFEEPWPAPLQTVAAYMGLLESARRHAATVTRTKVAKLLYLADLEAVREGIDPISGVEWKWLDHGPFNNCLQYLENRLVAMSTIKRRPSIWGLGWDLRLDGERPQGLDMPADDFKILDSVVERYGQLAAKTLKDLSYQTPPMVEAKKHGRGVVLNLDLARPLPSLRSAAQRLNAVLRNLPEQETEEGAAEDLVREYHELAPGRARANGAFLPDD